jgi:hypothetical protein
MLSFRKMGNPAKRAATYDDVLSAPEHQVAEVIGGDLVLSPRPAGPHAFELDLSVLWQDVQL